LTEADFTKLYGLSGDPLEDFATILWRVREWFLAAAAARRAGDEEAGRRSLTENTILVALVSRIYHRCRRLRGADRAYAELLIQCRDAATAVLRSGAALLRGTMEGRLERLEHAKELLEAAAPAVKSRIIAQETTATEPGSPIERSPATSPDWQSLLLSPPLSAGQIAEKLGQPKELVGRTLAYFRKQFDRGFIEDGDASVGDDRFRYKMPDVLEHLQRWYVKRQRRGKDPSA
jgi:hypothetical protein